MIRKILSVIVALAICLSMVQIGLWAADDGVMTAALVAAEEFAGGLGTEDDPYLIETAEQMKKLAEDVNGGKSYSGTYFKLTADIDLNGSEDNKWTPIGTSSKPFSGTFNGDKHSVTNVYVSGTGLWQGLFGYVLNGKIQNLGVDNGFIKGNSSIGGVVGCMRDATVENCYFTGEVSSTSGDVGGIVGFVEGGSSSISYIVNCYNAGTVTHTSSSGAGGIAGQFTSGGSITNCYNIGTVKNDTSNKDMKVGGIAGGIAYDTTIVENCYNNGEVKTTKTPPTGGSYVTSAIYAGGIVGSNSGTMQKCYNTGVVSGATGGYNALEPFVGDIAGYNNGTGTITDCYSLRESENRGIGKNSGTGTATYKTAEEFKDLADTLNTDNAGVWGYHSTFLKSHPILLENPEVSGTGTSDDPYLFRTPEGLEDMRDYINGTGNFSGNAHTGSGQFFGLANSINLGGSESNQWTPIGDYDKYINLKFSGTFDGGGHLISGLYINNNSANRQYYGLFGYVVGGTIENLGVNGSVTGNQYIGGIVGSGNNCTIENCYNIGNIKGNSEIGGICGGTASGSNAKFINCYNAGSVVASVGGTLQYAGGIVGFGGRSTIKYCYNIGSVTSDCWAGGIAGSSQGGTIEYCYNGENGTVSGTDAGGIVGDNGSIENCYNAGTVEGIVCDDDVGCVGGISASSYSVTNCYNIGKITGIAKDAGGIAGFYSDVTNCYNFGTIDVTADNVGGILGATGNVTNCYNIGKITGTAGNAGGIAGDISERNSIKNCYYLKGEYFGIGSTEEDTTGQAESKTVAQFKSGEVAWLLQNGQEDQVWYQKTGTDDYPVFEPADDSSIVYRVAFISGVEEDDQPFGAVYGNKGKVVDTAPSDEPTREGYEFVRWTTDKEQTGEDYEFTSVTFDDEDVDIYAVWQETYGENDEKSPLTIKLSKGESSDEYDLDELMAYSNGTNTKGNFTYTDTSGNIDGLTVNIDGSKLTVTAAADAAAGERTLNITAKEKAPQLSTIATLANFGTSDVELTVTVIIMGEQAAPDADDIEITKSKDSITVTNPTGVEYEFSIDGGKTWQPSGEFSGLEAGKDYTVEVRYAATDDKSASESAEKVVTTVNEDGSTTLKSGETVTTKKDETVTNKDGEVTIKDESTATVQLPSDEDSVEIDKDGNVIFPGKSVVEGGDDNPEMTLPDGGIVDSEGNVALSEGGDVELSNTTVHVPENGKVCPNDETSVTVPGGTAVKTPNAPVIEIAKDSEAIVDENGNVTFPESGSAQIGSSTVTVFDNGEIKPDGKGNVDVSKGTVILENDVEVELPEGGTIDADGNIVGGKTKIGGSTVENGRIEADGDGTVKVTKGSAVTPDNGPEMTLEEDSIIDSGGNIVEGSVKIGNTVVDVPDGGAITSDHNGNVTVTGDTTATFPNDMTIEIPAGSIIDKNGNITFPDGAEFQFGDTLVTIPEGGTVKPGSDSNTAVLPEGTTVTFPEDLEIEVPEGSVIDKNGRVTFPEGEEFELGDAAVTVPNGGYIEPNGDDTIIVSENTTITKDGEETKLPNGGIVDSDGNVLGEGFVFGDIIIIVPVGEEVTENENGTVTVPDGSVVKNPGNAPDIRVGDNGDKTVVDEKGNVTVPEDGSISIGGTDITVPDGGKIEPHDESSVEVPKGSAVTPPSGEPELTLPDGGIVDTDGNVTVPGGGSVEIGDTVITVPENGTVEPDGDGNVIVPEDSTVTPPNGPEMKLPDGGIVGKDGNVTLPDGGDIEIDDTVITVPENGTVEPDGDGNVIVPEDSTVTPPNGPEIELLDGGIVDSEGNVTLPDGGKVEIGDTVVTIPEGGTIEPNDDGTVTVPAGSTATTSDGEEIELPDGGIIDSEGNVTPNDNAGEGGGNDDDNSFKIGDTTIIPPEGEKVTENEDGTVTVPDGSVVKTPGAPDITVGDNDNKTTVDEDGNVTVPENGSVEVGGTTVTVPEGGTVEPNTEDGTVTVPAGSTATTSDGETIELPDGGTVDKDGNVKADGNSGEGNENDNSFKIGNTTITPPEGEKVAENEDGTVTVPDGSVVKTPGAPNITVGDNNDQTIVDENGNVTVPENGSVEIGENGTTVTVSEVGTIEPNKDGTVTVPEGSVVTPPGGPEMTLPDGGIMDGEGNVTLPDGGEVEIGGTIITVPENGTIEPNEDGTVTIPAGSTVEMDGETVTVPEGGAVYDPIDGSLTFNGNESGDNEPDTTTPPGTTTPGTTTPGTTAPETTAPDTTTPGTTAPDTTTSETTAPDAAVPDSSNVIVDSNTPDVSIDEESAAKLKEDVIANHLTAEEKAAVENGASLEIILSVEIAETTVSEGDRQTAEAVLANTEYTVGRYLSIELLKVIDGQQVGKITELNAPISIIIDIPEELKAENRVFAVVRVHGGVAEILEDQDTNPNTITIITDRFSTYAIVYQDNANAADKNQATGVVLVIAPFIAAAAGVIISKKRR